MREFAVFDIDGTLADDRHRRHLIDWEQSNPDKRYAAYHQACDIDPLVNENLVNQRAAAGYEIAFATSRPAQYHQLTVDWLRGHFKRLSTIRLLMRAEGDHRHSPQVKLEMAQHLAEEGVVIVFYEDRQDVCEKLATAGFNMRLVTTCGEAPREANYTPDAILRQMATTYQERDKIYGDNMLMVQPIVEILFPDGVPVFSTKMHILGLLLMKLTRFAVSDLTHIDSIHDLGAYAAIMESQIRREQQ